MPIRHSHHTLRILAAVALAAGGCGGGRAPTPEPADARAAGLAAATAEPQCWGPDRENPLHRYVHGPDSAYRWSFVGEERDDEGTLFRLSLVSQRWRGITWQHPLLLFVPHGPPRPDAALLVLRHGGPSEAEAAALRTASRATGTAAAFLFDVPNQPLFDGLEEDPLLAYTFSQYLRSGDESWPLLFPMVASAVRAMDAIEEVGSTRGGASISRFVLAGHSKRGHTAWLAGAADTRVQGIIPIASDVLDSPAQIEHHRAVAGEISASSQIFAEVIEAAGTVRGRCLMAMIDPFTYRDSLAEPKLVVLGTNDDYTPSDALNLYWDELPGAKSVLYLPNTGHVGTNSHPAINPAAFAFVRAVAAESSLPEIRWTLDPVAGGARVRAATEAPVRSVHLWVATAPGRDFRRSSWSGSAMPAATADPRSDVRRFIGEVTLPSSGYAAVLTEVEFEGGGLPFKLSTPIRVLQLGPDRPTGEVH
jgi:PhoPQ-activated pathogenicity-related protein